MYSLGPQMKILVNISETFILRGLNKNPKAIFVWTLDLLQFEAHVDKE